MFYGWRIVGVTFVTHFISVGFIFYSYGVFIEALEGEFGGSRLGVSIGLSLMNLATGLFAPFLGRALDKRSNRNIMCLGGILMAAGFFLASRITSLWQFNVILATFLGLGAAMIGPIAGSTIVSNWFIKRRGTALGISTMGVSMSGLFMAYLSTLLIHGLGWRATFVVYGLLTVCLVLPLVILIVVNKPEDIGLAPDGEMSVRPLPQEQLKEIMVPVGPGDQMIDHPTHLEWSSIGAIRTLNFWVITLTVGLNFFAMSATLTHMIPHGRDLGFTPESASLVLSASAGLGVVGKFLFGWIADKLDSRIAFWLSMTFQIVGMIFLITFQSYWAVLIAGAFFGLGMGGIVPLWGTLVGEGFGRWSFGRIMGLMSPCMLPLQTLGVPFAGLIHDKSGDYNMAYITFIGIYAAAALTLCALRREATAPVPTEAPAK